MLNPKFEYRNPKQCSNDQNTNDQNKSSFGHLGIGILNLFRISHFVLRISIWCLVIGICATGFADEGRLEQAKILYLKDDYSNTIIACRNILKLSPPADLKTQTLYLTGLSYLKLGDARQADSAFRNALALNPAPGLREKLELGLGETYFLRGETEEAQIQFKKILSAHPKSAFAPTLYFHLGHCALKLGKWSEAKSYLGKIGREYPLSFEAPIAQDILEKDEFYFTIQVGSFINQESAKQLYQALKDKGYNAYLAEFKSDASVFHRVRVGKFNQRAEAQAEEEKLKEDGFPTHLWP